MDWSVQLASWTLDDENQKFHGICPACAWQFNVDAWRAAESALLEQLAQEEG